MVYITYNTQPVSYTHLDVYKRQDERRALYPRLKDTKTLFGRTVFNIVITSYQIPKIEKAFLCEFEWRYLIVDEGHAIKNIQTQLSRYIGFVYKFNISYCAVILIRCV